MDSIQPPCTPFGGWGAAAPSRAGLIIFFEYSLGILMDKLYFIGDVDAVKG